MSMEERMEAEFEAEMATLSKTAEELVAEHADERRHRRSRRALLGLLRG